MYTHLQENESFDTSSSRIVKRATTFYFMLYVRCKESSSSPGNVNAMSAVVWASLSGVVMMSWLVRTSLSGVVITSWTSGACVIGKT